MARPLIRHQRAATFVANYPSDPSPIDWLTHCWPLSEVYLQLYCKGRAPPRNHPRLWGRRKSRRKMQPRLAVRARYSVVACQIELGPWLHWAAPRMNELPVPRPPPIIPRFKVHSGIARAQMIPKYAIRSYCSYTKLYVLSGKYIWKDTKCRQIVVFWVRVNNDRKSNQKDYNL